MCDGSKPFLKTLKDFDHNNFKISRTSISFVQAEYLQDKNYNGNEINYKLIGNQLVTSPESSYIIEKLTEDSLTLSTNTKFVEPKDLVKYYLVRADKAIKAEKLKNIDKDTLFATNIYGPFPTKSFWERHIKDLTNSNAKIEKKPLKNYKFKGLLYFNIANKNLEVKVKSSNPNDSLEIKKQINILKKSFKNWEFNDFNKYKIIVIPFNFISYYEISTEVESYGEVYQFYSNKDATKNGSGLTISEIESSSKYYAQGVKAYSENNYEQAVFFFEKCFKINTRNLDAYYNFASIQFLYLNKEKACKTWQFLKDEGQMEAKKAYDEKCVKN